MPAGADILPSDIDLAETESWLASQPDLLNVTGRVLSLTWLPGLCHGAVRVAAANGCFVLKRQRGGAADNIARELLNIGTAAVLGLGPEICWADPSRGAMLLRYLEGARPFRGSKEDVFSLGDVLGRLHGSEGRFEGTLLAGEVWLALADTLGDLPADLETAVQAALAHCPCRRSLVPSHGDLVPENILLTAARKPILIDWEFAAMADPAWDLAYVICEAELNQFSEAGLLESYQRAGGTVDPVSLAAHKVLTSAVAGLWALAEHRRGNPATDFLEFAEIRMRRAVCAAKKLS